MQSQRQHESHYWLLFARPDKEGFIHYFTWSMVLFFLVILIFISLIDPQCKVRPAHLYHRQRALMPPSMWQTSLEVLLICVCVRECTCASTHLTEKMASCFSYLHGCRIIEALQEKNSLATGSWCKNVHRTLYAHVCAHINCEHSACEHFGGIIHSV